MFDGSNDKVEDTNEEVNTSGNNGDGSAPADNGQSAPAAPTAPTEPTNDDQAPSEAPSEEPSAPEAPADEPEATNENEGDVAEGGEGEDEEKPTEGSDNNLN